MYDRDKLRAAALTAVDKKGKIGPDINLDEFDEAPVSHSYLGDEDLRSVPEPEQERLIMAGLDVTKQERGGTYLQKDTSVIHCQSQQEGIEVIPIRKALEESDWIGDYYWKLATVDQDKYTSAAELGLHDGYVIRALPGSKTIYPIQACLYLDKDGLQQNVHNIIIAEEGS